MAVVFLQRCVICDAFMVCVSTSDATVSPDGLASSVTKSNVIAGVARTVTATMAPAHVNQDGMDDTAPYVRHHLPPSTTSAQKFSIPADQI